MSRLLSCLPAHPHTMDLCQNTCRGASALRCSLATLIVSWSGASTVLTLGPFAIALPLFFTMHYGKQVTAHYAVAGLLTATQFHKTLNFLFKVSIGLGTGQPRPFERGRGCLCFCLVRTCDIDSSLAIAAPCPLPAEVGAASRDGRGVSSQVFPS